MRILYLAVLLCLPLAALAAAAAAPQVVDTVREPKSKVRFPVRLAPPGGRDEQALLGVAIRTRTVFKVKVYALGLYVDADAASDALERWRGRSPKALAGDEEFYRALVEGEFAKTIRMVMTRDVAAEDLVEAFDDVLKPRIRKAEERWEWTGGLEALERFRAQFDLRELKKDTELVFAWHPDGRLVTAVKAEIKGTIESPALAWALFDSYLGKDPVQDSIKRSLISRFATVMDSARSSGKPGSDD